MNKWQKEVLGNRNVADEQVLKELRTSYNVALKSIDDKIAQLLGREDKENIQSIIYQVEYQKALKTQISTILDDLNTKQFDTISKYLKESYEEGFLGTMYDLQGQGVPLLFPIDEQQIIRALKTNSKLSTNLYDALGVDMQTLKRKVRNEISRGISQGYSTSQIAKNLAANANISYNNAVRIARTESHRISQEATLDAQLKAKEAGADVVKQWDASMDKRTRNSHRQLDGQIREIDEPFEINGHKAMNPGGFGVASLDINCRCVILQRAKWALDKEELEILKKRAEYFGLDKTEDFKDYKKKYLQAAEEIKHPFKDKQYYMDTYGNLIEGTSLGHSSYQMDIPSDKIYNASGEYDIEKLKAEGYEAIVDGDKITLLNNSKLETINAVEDLSKTTFSLNEDGTYHFGKIKNQAEYKIDIPENQILNIDLKEFDMDDTKHMYQAFYNLSEEDALKAVKNEVLIENLPSELKEEFLNGNLVDTVAKNINENDIDEFLKKHNYKALKITGTNDIDDILKVLDDSAITKTKKSKLENLQDKIIKEQKVLNKIDNKTYSGIWFKTDVQVSDYPYYKNKIELKKKWYLQQLEKLDPNSSDALKYKQYLNDLDEFEELGEKYEKQTKKVKKLQSDIDKATPKAIGTTNGAYSDVRKNNAKWFTNKNGGFSAADKYYDPQSKTIHKGATSQERIGFFTYTAGSGGHNRPLAGFQKPWSKSGRGWEEQFYVGPKKVWIDYEGKGDAIRGLTTLIERSTYTDDVWLQSGQDFSTIEGLLGIHYGTLEHMTDSELQQFVGKKERIYNFISTAVNKGGGGVFNKKPLKINFYAPQGSQMLYASDVGAFGKSENEMILQRGGSYKITKIYWGKDATDGNKNKIFVDMEIHPEDGYDLFQQDPNEWKGSKKNYKSE